MGQPVAVQQTKSPSGLVVRFETNRSLTGQGHERFASVAEAKGSRPAAVLARRLLESGQISAVHVYSNIVTATLGGGATSGALDEIVRDLYQYWKPGMEPPSLEELMRDVEAPAADTAGPSDGAGDETADSRIPALLLERSRQARERWKAKNG